jgi:hypothetical protein
MVGSCSELYGKDTVALAAMVVIANAAEGSCIIIAIKPLDNGASGSGKALL